MRNIDSSSSGGRLATLETQNNDTTSKSPDTSSGSQSPLPPSTTDLDTIWSWNTTVPETISRCMHDLFVEQSVERPDHLAVQSWDGSLTYRQLDDLSTRLALYLIDQGIGIGTRIPLCFEKSMWAVVALVGAMKAGATVSMTDPSQPEARLKTIVEQTGAKIILTSTTQEPLGERIADNGQVISVSQSLFDNLSPPSTTSLPTVPPSSPMYIIFTSGSTGKPKGVVLSHESYTSGAIPRAQAVGYKASSRVFDFPSYAFDVTYDCMLCTLSVGGTICVPSEEARMNNLSGAIRDSKANMVHMTPSVARVLEDDIIPSLDVLGLGGEAVGARDAAIWGKDTSLIIAYGPSECTVGCTINNTVYESTGIGRGVGGVTWIVDPDDHNRLAPLGGVGELLVEGPVVGVGYLGEPEKTAEVFIEDPTWLVQGHALTPGRQGRLYKTGDLVRYEDNTTNGSIEFVGRKDQQVKLRGQRVELAEVEHHVRSCLPSGVKVAAEVVKPERGSPSLVAFVTEQGASQPGAEIETTSPSPELADALKKIEVSMAEKVPRYMIPASFIVLSIMPSLVSGKTDRKKLREFGGSVSQGSSSINNSAEDKEEPQTEVEKSLARAWCKVLSLDAQLYRGSSFFSLGGDSLRAMRLISAARDEGISLTVGDVFSNPLLRDMAGKATKYTQESDIAVGPYSLLDPEWNVETAREEVAALCEIDAAQVEDIYPCTPLQEALMALSAKVKEAYVAQRVVDLDDMATADRLIKAFSQAATESPILRTRIVQVPGRGLVQVVVREELSCQRTDDVASYLSADRDTTMSLGKPLVRYAIAQDKATARVSFILTMHHALYDGWSMPLIVERVNKAYHSQTLSRPADFRHFIRYLSSLDRSASADYWRENLEGAYANQFPRLPKLGYQVKADSLLEEYVKVPGTLPDNTTVATLIRAAWALVAAQYVGSSDVVFGETLTGRNAPVIGAEEIEGPMITTVPFRVQIDRDSTVREYLQGVQAQTVAQIPHEHYGLQHIRRLSASALDACELGAGLVLHPSGEETDPSRASSPADLLVPAGDSEAAQEALKFNTYALMLVCSIDSNGFLVMASFDSQCVEVPLMQRILKQLTHVTQKLCEEPASKIEDVECVLDDDLTSLRAVYDTETKFTLPNLPPIEGAYIVDERNAATVLPLGAPGKLIIRSSNPLDLPEIKAPEFFKLPTWELPSGHFYDTGKLAVISLSGKVTVLEAAVAAPPSSTPRPKRVDGALSRRQRKLRSAWSRVLQVSEADISLEDSFFALGGDSIYAMKLVSEARAHGILLSVMQIFDNKSLRDMAGVMQESSSNTPEEEVKVDPFELLEVGNKDGFIRDTVKPQLANSDWVINDIFPARPLQTIAVEGTVQIPRFSTRYELIKFDTEMPTSNLRRACQELVARNEILRTVFIKDDEKTYGVVLDQLETDFVEYDVDGDMHDFCQKLCRLDVLTCMPYGSSFVKWFFVRGNGKSSLIFRISHAQYDEMCLPIMLEQLSALSENKPVSESIPFSRFVGHVVKNIPASIPYWQNLLAGASMSILEPETPVTKRNHFAIEKSVDLTGWSSQTTFASLPTAAWALTLARRLATRDVFFGEVVSGRKTDFPNADAVTGPCWQYLPFRLAMSEDWTGHDLLSAVQTQHVSSAAHEGMALCEMTELCDLPNLKKTDWFGSVVHQAVKPVEVLEVGGSRGKNETIYVHEEPLKEWNVQAFFGEGELTIELITIESWKDYAEDLLEDITNTARALVAQPDARLFQADDVA
ncbi:peptide synthetase [Sarocladium strictum]